LFLVAFFTAIAASASYDGKEVEMIRDDYGIPHIFAETSEDAFFGLGYATAEDHIFQMEYRDEYITAIFVQPNNFRFLKK
jgi:acyl-homoserine lactone acylase PvdQ